MIKTSQKLVGNDNSAFSSQYVRVRPVLEIFLWLNIDCPPRNERITSYFSTSKYIGTRMINNSRFLGLSLRLSWPISYSFFFLIISLTTRHHPTWLPNAAPKASTCGVIGNLGISGTNWGASMPAMAWHIWRICTEAVRKCQDIIGYYYGYYINSYKFI